MDAPGPARRAQVGGVGEVVDHGPCRLGRADAHRRVHHLPGPGRRLLRREPAGQGPRERTARPATCTTRATTPPTCTARVDDAPFGGGAGMVMKPEPLFASRRSRRSAAAAAFCSAPVVAASTSGSPRNWPSRRRGRLLVAVRPLRGHRPPGARAPRRWRAECRRRRAQRRRGRCLPGHRGRCAACCRERWATRPARCTRASAPTALLEEPQFTRPADVPRLGRARGAARRRPRPHRALAACAGAASHRARPPRPGRGPSVGCPKPTVDCWKSSRRSPILDRSLFDVRESRAMKSTDFVDNQSPPHPTSPTSALATR